MEEKICFNCFKEYENADTVCPYCGFELMENQDRYPQALPCGSILMGRYIVGRAMGQGGFGITYAVRDGITGKMAVIKEYFPRMLSSREKGNKILPYANQKKNFDYGKKCFLDEAKVLAELEEVPNIVRVQRYFEENSTAYFVMDYLEGCSLEERLTEPISWKEMRLYIYPVMEALAIVHQRGIIHRDVAPDNIFITKAGEIRLLDFGAARNNLGRESQSLDVILKHGYAPKEQYSRHGNQGSWTDVYATAAVIYHGLTGRPPEDAIVREEGDIQSLRERGVDITPEMEAVLLRALEVNAKKRYQTMGEFLLALKQSEEIKGKEPEPPDQEDENTEEQKTEAEPVDEQSVQEEEKKPEEIKTGQGTADGESAGEKKEEAVKKKNRWKKWWLWAAAGLAVIVGIVAGVLERDAQNINAGDYVTFGVYEQDDDLTNGKEPIRWRVLAIEERGALVISEKCLDVLPYNEEWSDTTWEDSTIRAWLNGAFFEDSFSESEKQRITGRLRFTPGEDVHEETPYEVEKVFLLSSEEANHYFKSDTDRKAEATVYVMNKRISADSAQGNSWWLRSLGANSRTAVGVTSDGEVHSEGYHVDGGADGVRPAVYVSMEGLRKAGSSKKVEVNTETEAQETAAVINMENVDVGDYVTFGSYEQDNDLSNGKEEIRWRVLAKEDGKALVISEKCLDAIPYNEQRVSITWADCSLRRWLNGEFYENSFSDAEKQQITSQTIPNPDNPSYDTEGGEDTTDRVFLLSIQEAEQYFSSDADRQAAATAYGVEQDIYVYNGGSWWWLRSPGDDSDYAASVHSDGDVRNHGSSVDISNYGLRPALYISY